MTATAAVLGSYEDPDGALSIICDANGWDFAVVKEHQEVLRRRMLEEASAMAEGFCPRCKVRLAADHDYAGHCPSCDQYWHARYERDELMGTGAAAGWWVREARAS